MSLLDPVAQSIAKLLESRDSVWALTARPSLDPREIDGMSSCDLKSLLETLTVRVVDEPGEAVHHAFGGVKDAQYTYCAPALRKIVDDLFADRDGSGWKLDPVGIPRVNPMSLLLDEAEGLHRAIDSSGEAGWDEVEVVGFVLVVGVDRDGSAARQHDRDSVCPQA